MRCTLTEPVVSALVQLGAKADILARCGLQFPPDARNGVASTIPREETLTRMVCVVKTFAQYVSIHLQMTLEVTGFVHRHCVIVPQDAADLIMALILVGFDSSADGELRSEIAVAIEAIGFQMPCSSAEYSVMVRSQSTYLTSACS